jgi:hypothetical protein
MLGNGEKGRPVKFGPMWAVVLLGLCVSAALSEENREVGTDSAAMIILPAGSEPVWVPFSVDAVDLLNRATPLVPVQDGAMGASLLFLHEPGDDPVPAFARNGLPLGTGHRWTDDPWTVSLAGAALTGVDFGLDRWGGATPAVSLTDVPPDSDGATTDTRFTKATDDAYLRRVSFRTPRAPWTLRFDFDELIDQFPEEGAASGDKHHAKFRASRGAIRRHLADGSELGLTYEAVRKHKSDLPVYDADHQEIWSQRTALDWRGDTRLGAVKAAVFVNGTDVEWDGARKIDVVREGSQIALTRPDGGPTLSARVMAWRLHDDGEGTEDWAGEAAGPAAGGSRDAALTAQWPVRWGSLRAETLAATRWHGLAGWSPAARVDLAYGAERRWRLTLQHGGRAPRSDELLTAVRVDDGGHEAIMLPEAELGWESLDRAVLNWRTTVLGTVLELGGTARRLRDGIGWTRLAGETTVGRWSNTLDLDGWTLDLKLRRAGRFAGLARIEAILSRRGYDILSGTPVALPPEQSAVVNVFWEKRFYHEDGIFELGYVLEHRAEMGDPWLPGDDVRLPAVTLHHLLIGFRLVGVDLGFEFRNLTNQRVLVSAGSYQTGQTNRWRMQWTFRR